MRETFISSVFAFVAVSTPLAAAEGPPYSPVIEAEGVLYLAGHVGRSPETGALVEGGIVPETEQTLNNIKTMLKGVSAEMGDVVRCQVFLADINDYAAMNEVYRAFFPEPYPARTTVAVAALPLGANVEIQCTAVRQ